MRLETCNGLRLAKDTPPGYFAPPPSPPGAAGTNPSLKALGTTSAPPDFSTPRIAYGRSAVMGNTYTSFSRS